MPGVYRPRHPERTVLYRVLFHYFDWFLSEYESRFEKEYGFLRPIINHLKLTFVAERPPPPRIASQGLFMAAEERGERL